MAATALANCGRGALWSQRQSQGCCVLPEPGAGGVSLALGSSLARVDVPWVLLCLRALIRPPPPPDLAQIRGSLKRPLAVGAATTRHRAVGGLTALHYSMSLL
jgi:hypothetical protein